MRNDAATVTEKAPSFIGHEIRKGGRACHIKHHCEEEPGLAWKMRLHPGKVQGFSLTPKQFLYPEPNYCYPHQSRQCRRGFLSSRLHTPYSCVSVALVRISCLSSSVSLVPYLPISSSDYNASSPILGRQLLMMVVVHVESGHIQSPFDVPGD